MAVSVCGGVMNYEPLHQKYRPQTFTDLVGQGAIATTLTNAIESERIATAYLFTGPRGTGKTSSARIFAKSLNCKRSDRPTATPCGQCEVCQAIARGTALDAIEIDAASNTGVDNIRELIERAQFAPVQCRYKLYLIDEVHMLSTAAFNALLKTLEEPPSRVVFILATTDPQRVLPTIISRCQRFDFRRIPLGAMSAHLSQIARLEGIEITEEAIALVASVANGGLRDAESLLDQLGLLPGTVDVEQVWDLIGGVSERDLFSLLVAIRSGDAKAILSQTRQLLDRGKEPLAVLQNLAGFYRDLAIAKTAPEAGELVALTAPTWEQLCQEAHHWEQEQIFSAQQALKDSEGQLKNTTQPRLWLEVTLLTLLNAPTRATVAPAIVSQAKAIAPQTTKPPTDTPPPPKNPPQKEPATSSNRPQKESETPPANPVDCNRLWEAAIAQMRPKATQSLMKQMGRLVAFEGNVARVAVRSPRLLNMAKAKKSNIEAAFSEVCQRKIEVVLCVVQSRAKASATATESNARSTVSPVRNAPPHSESNQIRAGSGVEKIPSRPPEPPQPSQDEEEAGDCAPRTGKANRETSAKTPVVERISKPIVSQPPSQKLPDSSPEEKPSEKPLSPGAAEREEAAWATPNVETTNDDVGMLFEAARSLASAFKGEVVDSNAAFVAGKKAIGRRPIEDAQELPVADDEEEELPF